MGELRLLLEVEGDDVTREELEHDARMIRSDLEAAGMDATPAPGGPAPEGAKGALYEAGKLVVEVAHHEAMSFAVVSAFEWVRRNRHRRVRLKGPGGQEVLIPDTPIDEARSTVEGWWPQPA